LLAAGLAAGAVVAEIAPDVVDDLTGVSPSPPRGPRASVPPGAVATPPGTTEEPIESAPALGPGRVGRENLRRGTEFWQLPLEGKGTAEALPSDVSVASGDRLEIHVSSLQPTATLTLYRLGWYGGQGARV